MSEVTLTSVSSASSASTADAPPNPPATLGSVIAGHRLGLLLSAAFAVVAGVCSLAPYVAVYSVSVALFDPAGAGPAAIGWIAGATAAAIVLRALAAGLSTHVGHVAAYRILADLRRAIARQLQRLPLGRVQARSAGEMKKLLHDDVEQMEEALAHGVPDMAAAAAVPVATTVLLFVVDWRLALVALGALLLLVVVSGVGVALATPSNKFLAEHTEVLNRAVLGYLQGIKVIRGFLRPDAGFDQAREAIIESETLNARMVGGPLRWLVATMMAATGFAVALLIPIAGSWYADGTIGLPTLTLFLLVGLAYLSPIIALVGTIATIMARIQFSAGSIREILAEQPLPESTHPRAPERFDVAFDDVTFAYTDGGEPVLRGLSLHIPEGARFALVGPTGAGKSSIARLIARFWDATSGTVTIGGVDVRDIPQAQLGRLVAFVQQDEYLFAASLRENIRIARPGATDAEVEAAGASAQLAELVTELPGGWDALLPAGGGTLSGGQRQRVSIARALLKEAPIVVLDEATASLDARTERATLRAIDALTDGRTVIAIAHRLATIRGADRIAYIDEGAIAAIGTHDELLHDSDDYRTLWAAYTRAAGWRLERPAGSAPAALPALAPAASGDRSDSDDSIITAGVGGLPFARQWIRLLGRGRRPLLRQGLPKLLLEGLVRGIPLLAVFLLLSAAVTSTVERTPFDPGLVWILAGVVTTGLLVRLLLSQWANATVWRIAGESKMDLQLSIIQRLRQVPLGFFSRIDNGRITTLIGNDIVMLDFQNVPQQVAAALIQPVYVTIVLAIVDWRLALAALIGLPVFWAITAWSDRIYHRVFVDVHAARRDATMILIEQAKGAAVLRGNPGSLIATRFDQAVDRLQNASIDMSVRATPAIGLGSIAIESGLVALIATGGALYAAGAVPATTLLLFLVLSLALYQPIQELGVLAGYRHNQQQIAAKIAEVWDAPVLSEPEHPAAPQDASVEFRDVVFAYDSGEDEAGSRTVLDGVSFRADPGTITALVGPSGSGKSTIANLTARLWDPRSGSVLIGGQDLRDLGSDTVMRMVTTVYQDVYLFNDTIRYNLTLGRPDATEQQIWDALAAAQADDLVRALPAGLDTIVDEAGANLSGGQRQRLSIARALLKDSPILILDEAVASVDPDTEARIQDALSTLAAGRTVLVIAHRLDTIQDVDQILELNDDGTPTPARTQRPAPIP